MPLSLSALVADRKACTISFGEAGDLNLEYYPRKLTSAMLARYAAADPAKLAGASNDRALEVVAGAADTLLALLASWDLTAEEGGPTLPLTRETVEGLGIAVQWAILGGIMADGNAAGEASAPGGSASAPPSGAGSSPTGSSAPSPTGTPS